MTLDSRLQAYDACFDTERNLVCQELRSPGYHTRMSDGARVHPTRQSLEYALCLLQADRDGDRKRAAAIVEQVLSLQDTTPESPTGGIWPWFLEEPLTQMAPPDFNWADFLGALLLEILAAHADKLPAPLVNATRESILAACKRIVQRDVAPDYTSIAVMGAAVTAIAGERLGRRDLLDYGRQRLDRVARHVRFHGTFTEYNSPTYTVVTLAECERIQRLCADKACLALADQLAREAWRLIAEHHHPATGQWAGPHARAYTDLLTRETREFLATRVGQPIGGVYPPPEDPRVPSPPPCPETLVARFAALPADPIEVCRRFRREADSEQSVSGTTWLSGSACLGTVSRGSFWTQCRPVIAYWRAEDDETAVLRVRMLHNGRDFASGLCRTTQAGPEALVVAGLATDQGDWHPTLDKPADGLFETSDLSLVVELAGPGATVAEEADGFALRCGATRAFVRPVGAQLESRPRQWASYKRDDRVGVEVHLVSLDRPRPIRLDAILECWAALSLEILADDQTPRQPAPVLQAGTHEQFGQTVRVDWQAGRPLSLTAPARPV